MLNKLKENVIITLQEIEKYIPRKKLILLIVAAITLATSIIVITTLVDLHKRKTDDLQNFLNSENTIWKMSEQEIRGTQATMSIKFSSIDTDKNIVSNLRISALKHAIKIEQLGYTENNESIEVLPEVIPKDAFIILGASEEEIKEAELNKTNTKLKLESCIYFKNGYLGKFMSEAGQLEVIIAQFVNDNIYVSDRFSFIDRLTPKYSDESYFGEISEQKYIEDIKLTFTTLYGTEKMYKENYEESIIHLDTYFTADCKKIILEQIKGLNRDSLKSINTGLVSIGKSDLESNYIDRVYMQLELMINDNKKAYIDFELKLNKQGRIFSINIL